MIQRTGPIRLCIVCPKAYPVFNPDQRTIFGGAEVDIYFLATQLAKDQTFDVTVIVADYGQPEVQTFQSVRLVKGVDFSSCWLRSAWQLWRAFRRIDADIYLIKTISPGVPLLAVFCRLYKKAFIYRTSSGVDYDRSYFRVHRVMGWAFRRALRSADLVIAQTQQAAHLLKGQIGPRIVQVIPNAHLLGPFQKGRKDYILWVGRSDSIKAPQLFVELAGRFPGEPFVMICQKATGDTRYEDLVAQARAVPNLTFIEHVPFDQVQGYFQRAKVLVNTSSSEGFPNTFIHAFAAGVPVLSLAVDPDGILTREGLGYCAGGSLERMVEGLGWMLHEGRYEQMGLHARRYAEKVHDISDVIQTYKRLFFAIQRARYA